MSTASACAGARTSVPTAVSVKVPRGAWRSHTTRFAEHVAGDDVGEAVLVEIDDGDVGDERACLRRDRQPDGCG